MSGVEDLATRVAGAVLATRGARGVLQVSLTARRVDAGHEVGGSRLPLGATAARVAAGHLPLRDCHDLLLDCSSSDDDGSGLW